MKEALLVIVTLLTVMSYNAMAAEPPNTSVAGSFSPVGPPDQPSRHPVGDACIVDLNQVYALEGTLEGEMRIDFRIYVAGPCGSPPGTYDEHWIAHGNYSVKTSGQAVHSGTLTYLADISAGGDVDGSITFAEGLRGSIAVRGNFERRQMDYRGHLRVGSSK